MAYMAGWCHDAGYAFAPTRLDRAEAGGVILGDAGASFADAVCSRGGPDVPTMSDLLLIVNAADMMCGSDGVPVSFVERLSDVEARYGAGSRQAVDVGAMLSVLRRELEMRGVSVVDADVSDAEGAADSLWALLAAFRAPDHPSTRFAPARSSEPYRVFLVGVGGRGVVVLTLKCFRVRAYGCVVPVTSSGDTRRVSREACLHVV